MNRRQVFQSAGSAVAGLSLLAADPDGIWGSSKRDQSSATSSKIAGPFIESRDGTLLFCKEWGSGKPALFLHSWSFDTSLWQYQMIDLCSRGFRCIAYDKRGHGRSSDPGRGFDYDTLADDLHGIIEKLDLHDVSLIGHSMSCGEIVRYVSKYGANRVSRAVFVAPTLPFILKTPDNPDGVDKEAFEQLRASWQKDFPNWVAENAQPFFVPETSPAIIAWAMQLSSRASLKALVDFNHAITETDFRPELRRFTVPTLIIHGDADVSARIDFTGRRTASLIPGSQFKVYEGAPHGLMFTHHTRLNGDLLSFFSTLNGN